VCVRRTLAMLLLRGYELDGARHHGDVDVDVDVDGHAAAIAAA